MANTICAKCKREWQARDHEEKCPFCALTAELNMWKMKCAEADGNTERVSEERDRLRGALDSLCRAWFIEDGDPFTPAYQKAKKLLKFQSALQQGDK